MPELLPCYQVKNGIPQTEIVRKTRIPGKIFFVAKNQPIPGQREYLKTSPKVMHYSQLAFFSLLFLHTQVSCALLYYIEERNQLTRIKCERKSIGLGQKVTSNIQCIIYSKTVPSDKWEAHLQNRKYQIILARIFLFLQYI